MKLLRKYINYCTKKAETQDILNRYLNPVKITSILDFYSTQN